MKLQYEKDAIKEITDVLLKQGFRVFLAEKGTYGFYTNKEGDRLVSFQFDLGGINYSGNYKSASSGTGWRIDENSTDFQVMLDTPAPHWAIGKDPKWHYTNLKEHQDAYQSSSRYTELKA